MNLEKVTCFQWGPAYEICQERVFKLQHKNVRCIMLFLVSILVFEEQV